MRLCGAAQMFTDSENRACEKIAVVLMDFLRGRRRAMIRRQNDDMPTLTSCHSDVMGLHVAHRTIDTLDDKAVTRGLKHLCEL